MKVLICFTYKNSFNSLSHCHLQNLLQITIFFLFFITSYLRLIGQVSPAIIQFVNRLYGLFHFSEGHSEMAPIRIWNFFPDGLPSTDFKRGVKEASLTGQDYRDFLFLSNIFVFNNSKTILNKIQLINVKIIGFKQLEIKIN